MRRRIFLLARDPESEELRRAARAARSEYWQAYAAVRLIGSTEALQYANEFLILFDEWIDEKKFDGDEFADRLAAFTGAVRVELGAEGEGDPPRHEA